jgi:hypothetical protein
MAYWMMRLFLADRYAGTLLEGLGIGRGLNREDHLRQVFSKERRFMHRRRMHVFTPFPTSESAILCGVIAREHVTTIGRPPEDHYQKEELPDWETANVFIDISGESDGQKIAMQDVQSVGAPLPIFRSFIDYLNADDPKSDWFIAVNTITSDTDFWRVVGQHQGYISEVDLVFAAPNIWHGASETESSLKKLDKDYGVKETQIKLKNLDGKLHVGKAEDGGVIATAISYITRGGGRYKAKAGKKVIFNSEDHVVKSAPPEDSSIQDAEITVVTALATWLMSKR